MATTPVTPKTAQELYDERKKQADATLAEQLRLANQSAQTQQADLARLLQEQRKNYQLGRQQLSEQAYSRQRALSQAAASRGLANSGLQQLSQVQERLATGQAVNNLANQNTSVQMEAMNKQQGIANALQNAQNAAYLQNQGVNMENQALLANQLQAQQDRAMGNYEKFSALYGQTNGSTEGINLLNQAVANGQLTSDQAATIKATYAPDYGQGDYSFNETAKNILEGGYNLYRKAAQLPANLLFGNELSDMPIGMMIPFGNIAKKNISLKTSNGTVISGTIDEVKNKIMALYTGKPNVDKVTIKFDRFNNVRFVTPSGQPFATFNEASTAIDTGLG